ncbi:MAG: hypothetical protein QM758_11240 [Armatimonas sp.]
MPRVVDERDIGEVISRITGIPIDNMFTGEAERLLNLESHLHGAGHRGQNKAIDAVAEAIRRS